MEVQTPPLPPRSYSVPRRRRRSSPSSRRSRISRETDARIIKGAAMLRERLIRQQVFFGSDCHDHEIQWKSRDVIQRETQRIAEDLFSSSPKASRSTRRRSSSPKIRSPSPKRPDVTYVKSWPASRDSPSSRPPVSSHSRLDVQQVKSWSSSTSTSHLESPRHRLLQPRPVSPYGRLGVPPLSPPHSVSSGRWSKISETRSWSPSYREGRPLPTTQREERTILALDQALFPPLSPISRPPGESYCNVSTIKHRVSLSPFNKDDDCYESFSEIWDAPVKRVEVTLQETIPENLKASIRFDSPPRHSMEPTPFDEDAAQWAELSTIHSKDDSAATPDPRRMDVPEGSPCSIRTFPTSPQKEELSLKTPSVAPSIPTSSDTPFTYMGRDRKLKTKTITYLVEPYDVDDEDDETYDFVDTDYGDADIVEEDYRRVLTPAKPLKLHLTSTSSSSVFDQMEDEEERVIPSLFDEMTDVDAEYSLSSLSNPVASQESHETISVLRENKQKRIKSDPVDVRKQKGPLACRSEFEKNHRLERAVSLALSKPVVETVKPVVVKRTRELPLIPSPLSSDYAILLEDPAYVHAQNAGLLWQSIVGQHVRFPSRWWNGARSPPMGNESSSSNWQYAGRFPIKGHKHLKELVRSRGSPGCLLLHIVVQDLMTRKPIQDIAIGCFHPNARGVRQTAAAINSVEDNRDVWLAVRKRCEYNVSVLDHLLLTKNECTKTSSPLGVGQRVTNQNMRVVFGDKPPVETIFCPESELFECLSRKQHLQQCPAMLLLEAYVFCTVDFKSWGAYLRRMDMVNHPHRRP